MGGEYKGSYGLSSAKEEIIREYVRDDATHPLVLHTRVSMIEKWIEKRENREENTGNIQMQTRAASGLTWPQTLVIVFVPVFVTLLTHFLK